MAEAKIDMSAADRNVLALIQQIAKGFDKIAEAQGKVEVRSKEVSKTSESGFDKMVTGGARALASWAGISSAVGAAASAIRLATADYEHFNQQIERSRQAALNIAPAHTQAALSFTPDASAKSFADIEKQVQGISEGQKIPQATVYQLSSAALGDRGTLSNAQAMSAVGSTLNLAPNLPADEQAYITRAMLGLMNTYGLSADEAKGLVLQGAAEHKVGTAEYAKNVVPTIKNIGNMGGTMQEGFALTAGMANAMGDAFGRESSTGAETLVGQVKEATERFADMRGKSFDERLAFLNSNDPRGIQTRLGLTGVNDKDAAKYGRFQKGSLTGSQGAEATMLSILNQQGEGWNQYQDSRSKAVDPATAAKFAASKEAEMRSSRVQRLARADLASQAEVEAIQMEGTRAEQGQQKKTFEDLLTEQTALGPLDRTNARFRMWAKTKLSGMGEGEAGAKVFRQMKEDTDLAPRALFGDESAVRAIESLERAAQAMERGSERLNPGPVPNGPPPLTSGAK